MTDSARRPVDWRNLRLSREGRLLARSERFSVQAGERVLLTGPSGSGKSSLLLALAGLASRDVPGLEAGGELEATPRVALLQQNPYAQLLAPSAATELAFGLENAATPTEAMREIVARTIDEWDLAPLASRAPWTFSGGEAQRLCLAASLAVEPELALLDEPLGYLDAAAAKRLLERVAADGRRRAWIVVDHDPLPWLEWADTRWRLEPDGTLRKSPSARGDDDAEPRALAPSPPVAEIGSPPVLEARGIRAGYRRAPDALRLPELFVEAGETVALAGPNGAGKTTLLRCLAGALPLRAGSIRVAGKPHRPRLRAPGPFAWVPQVPEHYFVRQTAREEWGDATELAECFGLASLAERHPFTLSEGEKRRLTLASALADDRPLVMLDEPQFGLDRDSLRALESALETARDRGRSFLVVSHDPRFRARVAHREVALAPPGPGGAA